MSTNTQFFDKCNLSTDRQLVDRVMRGVMLTVCPGIHWVCERIPSHGKSKIFLDTSARVSTPLSIDGGRQVGQIARLLTDVQACNGYVNAFQI